MRSVQQTMMGGGPVQWGFVMELPYVGLTEALLPGRECHNVIPQGGGTVKPRN